MPQRGSSIPFQTPGLLNICFPPHLDVKIALNEDLGIQKRIGDRYAVFDDRLPIVV